MSVWSTRSHTFDAVLNALGSGAGGYFGDPNAVLDPIQRIDRPLSSLLRVRIRTAAGESHAFVKVYKIRKSGPEELAELRRLLENEYRMTVRAHEAFRSHPGLCALRPVAMFLDQLAIVTSEVPGQTFDRIVRSALWGLRSPSAAVEAARRIGAWVRTYQAVTPPQGKVTAGREYLDVRLRALVGAVLTAEDREFALRAFDLLTARAGGDAASRVVAIHGDLCPSNIVVQPKGDITILDFMTAKSGAPYHDIAHLFLHLESDVFRMSVRRRFLSSVQHALIAEFDGAACPEDPAFKLMLLQHCACQTALWAQRSSRCGLLAMQPLRRRWHQRMRLWAPGSHPF